MNWESSLVSGHGGVGRGTEDWSLSLAGERNLVVLWKRPLGACEAGTP